MYREKQQKLIAALTGPKFCQRGYCPEKQNMYFQCMGLGGVP